MRFLGSVEAKADAKGRFFFPASFRKLLQSASEERLILRKDVFQDCLTLYPESVWNEQLTRLRKRLSRWSASEQALFRQFISDVEILTLDSNGRILIPKRYLKAAGINQDARFIGMDDVIELWSREALDKPFVEAGIFAQEIEKIMHDNENEQ